MALWLGAWWMACLHRGDSLDAVARATQLRVVDEAWGRRGELGIVEAARPLLVLAAERPQDLEIRWRSVRLRVVEGLASDDETLALRTIAEARSLGLACLDTAPGFTLLRRQGRWGEAVDALTPEHDRCLGWTTLAWVRWMLLQGPASATLDLDALDGMVAGADPQPDGVVAWAGGLLAAARPPWTGRDLEAAAVLLERAIAADPDALVRRADRLVWIGEVPDATLEDLLARAATRPEDVRARQDLVNRAEAD